MYAFEWKLKSKLRGILRSDFLFLLSILRRTRIWYYPFRELALVHLPMHHQSSFWPIKFSSNPALTRILCVFIWKQWRCLQLSKHTFFQGAHQFSTCISIFESQWAFRLRNPCRGFRFCRPVWIAIMLAYMLPFRWHVSDDLPNEPEKFLPSWLI